MRQPLKRIARGWSMALMLAIVPIPAARAQVVATFNGNPLAVGAGVQGWNNQIVLAKGAQADFGLIFGDAPGVGANLTAWGKVTTTRNEAGEEEPEWTLDNGYAVARGSLPTIRTNVVRAVSESSVLIVEIDRVLGCHRVYLDEGDHGATVYIGKDDATGHRLIAGQFIEVDSGSKARKRGPMPYDIAAADFVARVKAQPKFDELPPSQRP